MNSPPTILCNSRKKDGCFLPPHHSHQLKVISTNQQCKNNLAVTTFEYIKTIGRHSFAYVLREHPYITSAFDLVRD